MWVFVDNRADAVDQLLILVILVTCPFLVFFFLDSAGFNGTIYFINRRITGLCWMGGRGQSRRYVGIFCPPYQFTHWKPAHSDRKGIKNSIKYAYKALKNKNAILVFAFQTPPHFQNFGWTFAVGFFSSVYHPQDVHDEMLVRPAVAHWEHGKRDDIDGIDGIATGWHSVGIPSEFCCDSVDSRITSEPGFSFLHVPSVLGSNFFFHLGRLGVDRLQKQNLTAKVHRKCVKYENCIFICWRLICL